MNDISYEVWSYIIYAGLTLLGIIVSVVIKVCEKKFGKKAVQETLTEAETYRKAITDAIESAEKLFPGASTGEAKKTVATLAVTNVVNTLKDYKPTAEEISEDIDTAIEVTKVVNAKKSETEASAETKPATTKNDAE